MNATTVNENNTEFKTNKMAKSNLAKSAVVLLSTLGVMSFTTQADDSFTDTIANAISGGKTSLGLRYRYENVDQENIDKTANSSTLKTRLTFQSADMWNLNFKLEVDNITAIGNDSYNSTANGKTQYPVVADPEDTDYNQAYIQYKRDGLKFTAGRQRIVHNDQRFIGGVAWRQNEQTFDGYRLEFNKDKFTAEYAYIYNVNRIFGPDGANSDFHGDVHMLNGSYAFSKEHKLSLFAYGMDFDNAPGASNDTIGFLYNGSFGPINLTASYADQSDGGDNPKDFDTSYTNIAVDGTVSGIKLGIGWEQLDGDNGVGFMTPLATLHKWQGFADQFLGTPGRGIEDLQLNISGNAGPVKLGLVWHDLSASEGGSDYGTEIDFTAAYKVNKHVTTLLKYSDFNADNGGGKVDVQKLWLMVNATF